MPTPAGRSRGRCGAVAAEAEERSDLVRAVQVTRTDGPEALEVGEVADPVRGERDVLVEVRAAGINFPDLLLSRDLYQYKPERPFVLGSEFAGVVREAPEGWSSRPATGWSASARPGRSPSSSP